MRSDEQTLSYIELTVNRSLSQKVELAVKLVDFPIAVVVRRCGGVTGGRERALYIRGRIRASGLLL